MSGIVGIVYIDEGLDQGYYVGVVQLLHYRDLIHYFQLALLRKIRIEYLQGDLVAVRV